MNRSKEDLSDSIKLLEFNLITCEPFNCFGDDNRLQITIMLDVIKFNRSARWISLKYVPENPGVDKQTDNCCWRAAMDAREWLDGVCEIDELLYPQRTSKVVASTVTTINKSLN